MAGFEESGLPGEKSICEGFQGASEPESFITQFQQENCILLTSLAPALHLLDLQDVKRVTFHQTVVNDLFEKLKKRIGELNNNDEEKLSELLDHIFHFIHVDVLRPIVMDTMKKTKNIKPEYIEQIASHEKIYKDCPIEVKRRVWMNNHPMFGDAVGPILNKYIEEKNKILFDIETVKIKSFYNIPPRQRRQKAVIKELVDMIGGSIELYNLVLQFLRTLYLRTKEEHYCSLRGELLMAFHDADIKEIRQVDPCHKFAWLLDACIRDKSIDTKRLKELQSFLDSMKKTQEEILGDIGMILCDPYATYTIVQSIIQHIDRLMKAEQLPRSSNDLAFLVRLLLLSVHSWNMLKNQDFKEDPINIDIITKFLPMIISLMLDNTSSIQTITSDAIKLPDSLWKMVETNQACQCIFSFFVNQLIMHNKKYILSGVLPGFATALKNQPISATVGNLFVHSLLRHQEAFTDTSHCKLIFDQFLMTWVQYEEVLHHILRLLWCAYEKIDSQLLVAILTAAQPALQHSDAVHDVHARLVDMIASWKVNTPSGSSNTSSPALSISPVVSPGLTVP
ncbi:negative elongation factor B-like [Clytia hemisphaerica]|uniref:Negative elongation factor B n=1 Tax=Clytia hemisphaerica TaxID=252671 RepID=A0A7M5UZZ7_9CNID